MAGFKVSGPDDPRSWYGTRTVTTMAPCGWCSDAVRNEEPKFHDDCIHEVAWFDKLYTCSCSCNASWVPVNLTVERPPQPEKIKKSRSGRRKPKTEETTDDEQSLETDTAEPDTAD